MIVSNKFSISSRENHSRCVTTKRTDVNHTSAEFDEGSTLQKLLTKETRLTKARLPFYRDIKVCDVVENEVNQRFIFFLAKEADE